MSELNITKKELKHLAIAALLQVFVHYIIYQWMLADTQGSIQIENRLNALKQVQCIGDVERKPWECESCSQLNSINSGMEPFHMCNTCNQSVPLLGYKGVYNITERDLNMTIFLVKSEYYESAPILLLFRCMYESSWWCHGIVDGFLTWSYNSSNVTYRISESVHFLAGLYDVLLALNLLFSFVKYVKESNRYNRALKDSDKIVSDLTTQPNKPVEKVASANVYMPPQEGEQHDEPKILDTPSSSSSLHSSANQIRNRDQKKVHTNRTSSPAARTFSTEASASDRNSSFPSTPLSFANEPVFSPSSTQRTNQG